MAWTLGTYIDEALRAAELEDDLGDRWPTESIKRLFGTILLTEWRALLGRAPLYRFTDAGLAVTPAGDGIVTGSALRAALELVPGVAPNSTPHRILRVARGPYLLDERPALTTPFLPAPAGDSGNALDDGWRAIGADASGVRGFQLLRADAAPLTVWCNYVPPQLDDATPDEQVVDWPAAHAFVLVYHLAGKLLTKGGVEEQAAAGQFRLADVERTAMYDALKEFAHGPTRFTASDNLSDWTLNGGF